MNALGQASEGELGGFDWLAKPSPVGLQRTAHPDLAGPLLDLIHEAESGVF